MNEGQTISQRRDELAENIVTDVLRAQVPPELKWQPLPEEELGAHVVLAEFISGCEHNCLTRDDGVGYYATATQMSNVLADPCLFGTDAPAWATHVVWFNK